MEQLFRQLQAMHPLSEPCLAALREVMQPEQLPARQMLLSPGHVAQRVYFVEKGLARGYYLKDGREVNAWFMHEQDFLISIVSFLTQTPSEEYIELLEDSVLWSISYVQLQNLYATYPEFNVVGRLLTEHYYVRSEKRTQQLRLQSAEERYNRLAREFPTVLQRVPLKHLASYLGITPETLSRVRAQRSGMRN